MGDKQTTAEPPERDVVERLIERRDLLSCQAAEIIMAHRGANKRVREMLRQIRELPDAR